MLWVLILIGLGEALLMSTHIICFHAEIIKIICGYPLLSVAVEKHLEDNFELYKNFNQFFLTSSAWNAKLD